MHDESEAVAERVLTILEFIIDMSTSALPSRSHAAWAAPFLTRHMDSTQPPHTPPSRHRGHPQALGGDAAVRRHLGAVAHAVLARQRQDSAHGLPPAAQDRGPRSVFLCIVRTPAPRTNLTRYTLGGAVALLCAAARVQPNTVQTLREAAARHPNDATLQTHVRLTLERLGAR